MTSNDELIREYRENVKHAERAWLLAAIAGATEYARRAAVGEEPPDSDAEARAVLRTVKHAALKRLLGRVIRENLNPSAVGRVEAGA